MKGQNTVVLSNEAVEQALQDYVDKVFADGARVIVQSWKPYEPQARSPGALTPRLELELIEKES